MFFISLRISEKVAFTISFLAKIIILLFPTTPRFCCTASLNRLFILFLFVALPSILLETTKATWGLSFAPSGLRKGKEEKEKSFKFCLFPFFATEGMSFEDKRNFLESILNCELFAAF